MYTVKSQFPLCTVNDQNKIQTASTNSQQNI